MKIAPLKGTGKKRTGLFFDFREQWSSLVRHCNWYDFTLIEIGGEFAPYTGRWDVSLALLGLSCRLTWVYDGSFNERMLECVAEIKRARGVTSGSEGGTEGEP